MNTVYHGVFGGLGAAQELRISDEMRKMISNQRNTRRSQSSATGAVLWREMTSVGEEAEEAVKGNRHDE
jgi:hypothetical protein